MPRRREREEGAYLVHIAGALVEVGEWREICNDRENVGFGDFLVCGLSWRHFRLVDGNVEVDWRTRHGLKCRNIDKVMT